MPLKSLNDPANALAQGLAAIRQQYAVPASFPPQVLDAANTAAARSPTEHVDRTDVPFVTLDPASSTDLDQAFWIEASGGDLILRYAIADVAWFVADGDPLDIEAWHRGTTFYLPDGKAPLYPPVLSQGAASLLPDGPRPAVVFAVRVAGDGTSTLDGVERAVIRSRAKLAYETATADVLPPDFAELSRRIAAAEAARGASRNDPPEQEVDRDADGRFTLAFKPRLQSEIDNAAMSLATNLAVGDALLAHRCGLFRVMAEPDDHAVSRLRYIAAGLGLHWSGNRTLKDFLRTLDPADPKQAAFMLAERRVGKGASYQPYQEGVVPWHAAMAATYAQATAPLRRLADRYVVQSALAVANGRPLPQAVSEAIPRLPPVMAKADAVGNGIDRAVIDLAEAIMLQGREGESFAATVTDVDAKGARIQIADPAIVARMNDAKGVEPGDTLQVTLTAADPDRRQVSFARTAGGSA